MSAAAASCRCHAAFVAIGAYVSVLAGQHWQLSFLPATVLGALAAGAGAGAGMVILRLRGVYFVLVTFAFGELLRLALLDGAALTGGANGIAGIAPAEILGYAFSRGRYYGLALGAALPTWALGAVPAPAGTRHRRGGGQPRWPSPPG